MSLLPGRILPASEPFGTADAQGVVTIDKNWWLLLYNLCLQVLGNGSGLPADALIDLEGVDTDAVDADAVALRRPLANLAMQMDDLRPTGPEFSDLVRALVLAQDGLLPEPLPLAQPASTVTVGGSPFTYTAPFSGSLALSGGTVSLVQVLRQGVTVGAGVTSGLVPVSRGDQVKITYSAAPTAVFLPT